MSTEDYVGEKTKLLVEVFPLMSVILMTLYLKVTLFFINLLKYQDIVYINLYVFYGQVNYF